MHLLQLVEHSPPLVDTPTEEDIPAIGCYNILWLLRPEVNYFRPVVGFTIGSDLSNPRLLIAQNS